MEKMIKLYLPFFLFLASACTHTCEPEAHHKHRLLIFLDKSTSVDGQDPRLEARVKQALTPILDSNIMYLEDYVEVHLIHGASIGAKTVLEKSWTMTRPCKANMGPDSYEQSEIDYQDNLKKFRRSILNELLEQLHVKSVSSVVYETDLLGALEVASFFSENRTQAEKNTVVFISDMVHSTDAPRDYHKKPIKDLAEADACAKNDLSWLKKNRKINPIAFDSLDIKIRFTGGEFDKTQNEQMRYYWSALFKELNPSIKIDIQ